MAEVRMRSRQHLRLGCVLLFVCAVTFVVAFGHLRLFTLLLGQRVVLQPTLLRSGFVPYQHIADQKPPLLPLFLSWLLPLFRADAALTARVVHGLLISAIMLACLLWTYRVGGTGALVATGAFFLAWSGQFGYWAAAYYELALSPFYWSLFVLLVGKRRNPGWTMAAAGLLTGIALLIKQYAVLLVLICLAWLAWQSLAARVSARRTVCWAAVYSLGLLLPLAAYACTYYRQAGSFQDLVYWTLTFNILGDYRSLGRLAMTAEQAIQILPSFLMTLPFIVSVAFPTTHQRPARGKRIWLLLFLAIAAVNLYPRYSSRHWATALPFLAAVSGIACGDLLDGWGKEKAARGHQAGLYAAVVLWWTVSASLSYLPRLIDPQPQRVPEYGDLVELAERLEGRLPSGGGLVLLPADEGISNLYYILQRQPPHFWTMNYPWFMTQYANRRWLETMDKEKPRTLLYFENRAKLEQYAPEILAYVQGRYQTIDTLRWKGKPVHVMELRDAD